MRFAAGFIFILLSALPPLMPANAKMLVKEFAFPWQEALAPKAAGRDRFVVSNRLFLSIAGEEEFEDDIYSNAEPDPLLISVEATLRTVKLPEPPKGLPNELIADVPVEQVCEAMAKAADESGLPVSFFARLLYQESGFQQRIVSHAGAQGVAQFMPQTAAYMGLHNPFDPIASVAASARFLRELFQQFGNIGLAAAAYNAGPRRIQDWLAQRGKLPDETRNYVKIITGNPVENWTAPKPIEVAGHLPRTAPCEGIAGLSRSSKPNVISVELSTEIGRIVAEAKERAERAAKAKAERARLAKARKDKSARSKVAEASDKDGKPAAAQAESRQQAGAPKGPTRYASGG